MKHIPRLYVDTQLKAGLIVSLPEASVHHVLKVLRLTVDAPIILFNGNGYEYTASIIETTKRTCAVEITQETQVNRESPLHIHLAQGISRSDRMELVIQKAVELGVTEITPLLCQKGMVKLTGERLAKKHNHWHNIILSACEQSGRTHIPTLHPIQSFEAWVSTHHSNQGLILDPAAKMTFKDLPKTLSDCTVLIGPESGFSAHELTLAQAKFTGIQIGPRILRTETAPIAIISALQSHFGDW